MGDRIGVLAPGRDADLIAVDLSGHHAAPATEPYSALVYSCRASDVLMTMIGGRTVFERGKWLTLEAQGILGAARAMRSKMASEGMKT